MSADRLIPYAVAQIVAHERFTGSGLHHEWSAVAVMPDGGRFRVTVARDRSPELPTATPPASS